MVTDVTAFVSCVGRIVQQFKNSWSLMFVTVCVDVILILSTVCHSTIKQPRVVTVSVVNIV